jgi:hypothetical protein
MSAAGPCLHKAASIRQRRRPSSTAGTVHTQGVELDGSGSRAGLAERTGSRLRCCSIARARAALRGMGANGGGLCNQCVEPAHMAPGAMYATRLRMVEVPPTPRRR